MKKPNSFWKVWYEGRPSVVQISADGKGFFALGQDAIWGLGNAEFIEEINMFPVSYFSGQKFIREGVQFRLFSSRHDDGAYLMNLDTDCPVTKPVLVQNHSNITFEEFAKMCGGYSIYSFNPV